MTGLGCTAVHSAFSEANLAEAFSQLGRFDEAIEHGDLAARISETADHPVTLSLEEHLTTATAMYRDMGMTFWLEKAEAELARR